MLKSAAEFIKQCEPSETTIVYHGGCGDGITAAAILLRTFKKHFGAMPKSKFASPGAVGKLALSSKFVVLVDLAVGQEKDYLTRLAQNSNILILDHHELTSNLNKEANILQVHPSLFSDIPGVSYPGAKLAFDACSLLADIQELDWLAAVGLVHDVAGKAWKGFIDSVFNKYKELGKKSYTYESKLGEISSILTAGQEIKNGNALALKVCLEAQRPSDILEESLPETSTLVEINKEREKELKYYVDNWEKLAEFDKKLSLVFYDVDLKHRISSAIATSLSLKNPDLLFVIMNKESPAVLKINFRQAQQKVDCAWLARASTEPFGGAGGGHKPAAGARIPPKYKEKFKERVRELLK